MSTSASGPPSNGRRRRRRALADTIGVPLLPPPAVTRAAKRIHAANRRLRARSVPPPAQIMESLLGIVDHHGISTLCQAGVVDALVAPETSTSLAARLDLDPERLELLLRLGVARGWLAMDRRGRFRPNRVTRFLRRDHPGGWRAWVDLLSGGELIDSIRALSLERGDEHTFQRVHGLPFHAWLEAHPDRWEVFDRAQAVGGRMHGYTLAEGWDWTTTTTVCDVGGGTGALLAALVELHPHLQGTLFDLPPVVARATPHDRVDLVAGDAFDGVPSGHDAYLLVNIVHMWSDADATSILRQVALAARPHSQILVVESQRDDAPSADMTAYLDVVMAALTDGGKERGPQALERIGSAAGLRLQRSRSLGTGDVLHQFVLAG